MIAAVTFYAASYFARGFLAGEQRFALYGGLVLMESASRVVFVVLLAVGVRRQRERRRDRDRRRAAAEPVRGAVGARAARAAHGAGHRAAGRVEREPEFTLSHGLGFAGAVLVIMCSEQAILNSGVLIVKVETGDDALAALIFAVLMIARAPLQLFQAVSTTLLPHLTRLLVREEDEARGGDFGRSVRLTVIACLAFGAATVVGVLLVGPAAMRLLFGPEFDYDRDRARDGGGGDGALPVGDDRQPGGARAGPRAARRRVVGGVRDVLRRVPAGRERWRRCARSRSRSSRRPACSPRCCTSPTAARPTAAQRIRPGLRGGAGDAARAADEGSV